MPYTEGTSSTNQPDMERIVEQYGTTLLRMCFLYLKDKQLAEDAVQDTFIKVYRNYHQFQGQAHEKTWILRIAINVCKDYLRCAWHRKVTTVESLADVLEQSSPPPAEDKLLVEKVMQLKPKYREVLLLYYYQDMKISQIAEILQTPESTISVRLKRAREQLKKQLEGWDWD